MFYTYFYNHAHRLRLKKLLYLVLSRSPNGFSGGGFTSETAARRFQKLNGRYETVSEVKRLQIYNDYIIFNGHSPTDTGVRSGVTVTVCNGRGRWPKATVLFWCGNL